MELPTFVAVAQGRSFRRAAARLDDLAPSSLSHIVRGLEWRLGTRLLNRTTRSVAPTEAGMHLLTRLAPASADIDGAVEALNILRDRPAGTVRLTAPRMAAQMALAPVLGRFASLCPDLHLDVTVDDGPVDVVAAGPVSGAPFVDGSPDAGTRPSMSRSGDPSRLTIPT